MGKEEYKDSPDLRIVGTSRTIGIEHTQILNNSNKEACLKAEEVLEEQVVNKAQKIFEQKNSVPIYVNTFFLPDAKLFKPQVNGIAYSLATLVSDNIPEKGEEKSIESWQTRNKLPPEIDTVHLEWYENATYPMWAVPRSGFIPDLTPKIVTNRIRHKERYFDKYRECCNEIWLVIVIDGYTPAGSWEISSETIESEYVTQFDRVVLFDYFSGTYKDLVRSCP